MRQGGYTPKNHNSGVYWVRAQAGKGKSEVIDNREKPKWYHYVVAGGLLCWLLLSL